MHTYGQKMIHESVSYFYVTHSFFRAVRLLNQNKRKIISSIILAIRRKEKAPRTPPMIAVESVEGAGITGSGSEAKA